MVTKLSSVFNLMDFTCLLNDHSRSAVLSKVTKFPEDLHRTIAYEIEKTS